MSNQGPQLDYGHDAPVWKRRKLWRWVFRGAVIAVVVLIASICIQRVYYRSLLIQAERQCLNYTAPSNQVVYDEDPHKTTLVSPPVWDQFEQLFGLNGLGPECVLFLHERISTGGAHRLVPITFDRIRSGSDQPWNEVRAISVEQQSMFKDANIHIFILHGADMWWQIPPTGILRFYAGQSDPADPSHFTIAFESEGKKGMIDGWLLDDPSAIQGVKIKLAVRNPPATSKSE